MFGPVMIITRRVIVQVRIIWHELFAAKHCFDDRVASIVDFVAPVIVMDGRIYSFSCATLRQREQHVQPSLSRLRGAPKRG